MSANWVIARASVPSNNLSRFWVVVAGQQPVESPASGELRRTAAWPWLALDAEGATGSFGVCWPGTGISWAQASHDGAGPNLCYDDRSSHLVPSSLFNRCGSASSPSEAPVFLWTSRLARACIPGAALISCHAGLQLGSGLCLPPLHFSVIYSLAVAKFTLVKQKKLLCGVLIRALF